MRRTKLTVCGHCGHARRVMDGGQLRKLRIKAGHSLREMARRLGLSVSYLCDVELNRRNTTAAIESAYALLVEQAEKERP